MEHVENKSKLFIGIILTIFAYLCFSITSALVNIINNNIPVIQIVFFQSVIGFFCILPYSVKSHTFSLKSQSFPVHIVRGITGLLSYITYFSAIQQLNLIDATVLAYTAPFYTPLIWKFWMHGSMENDVWWTIILGFIGIAFILKPSGEILQIGALLGILAGILTACSFVSIKILNQRFEPLSRTLLCYFFLSSIATLPFAIMYWVWPANFTGWLQLFLIGITTAAGQLLLTVAYKYGTASFLSPLCYFMIIFTMLISWWFFEKIPGWGSLVGAFLIIFGGTLTFIVRKKPKTLTHLFMHPHFHKKKFWKK